MNKISELNSNGTSKKSSSSGEAGWVVGTDQQEPRHIH